jgi:hypothetical protein
MRYRRIFKGCFSHLGDVRIDRNAMGWLDLKTIAMIEETHEVGGKTSIERRFFIKSSIKLHWHDLPIVSVRHGPA